jgi:hypothetical protein
MMRTLGWMLVTDFDVGVFARRVHGDHHNMNPNQIATMTIAAAPQTTPATRQTKRSTLVKEGIIYHRKEVQEHR